MKSETTKNLTPEALAELKKTVKEMNDEERDKFRNGFDPDEMGFSGEEGAVPE